MGTVPQYSWTYSDPQNVGKPKNEEPGNVDHNSLHSGNYSWMPGTVLCIPQLFLFHLSPQPERWEVFSSFFKGRTRISDKLSDFPKSHRGETKQQFKSRPACL